MNAPEAIDRFPELESAKCRHVVTLTSFYPSESDDASGCFVSEPLPWLAQQGIVNSVIAVQPFYRGRSQRSRGAPPADWFHYLSMPGGVGLSSAGAFVFARIVGHIRKLHRERPISLIHAHAPLPCGHAAMLLSRELGIPFVVSVHGLDAFSTKQVSGRAGQWCRNISQRVFLSAKRVICVSERARENVLEGTEPGCRTSVVYNGVDPRLFAPPHQESADNGVIVSVGNLIPSKGHALLLRSIAELSTKYPGLTCEIIGDGAERERLAALAAELDITQRVNFCGRLCRSEVAEALQRCTVFALPSRYEGLGCVYLEAMSTGKPAIACRGQGIAEIIRHGNNGWLVGADNLEELTAGLAAFVGDECLRRKVGGAARRTVLDALTLSHQAARLCRVYEECMG